VRLDLEWDAKLLRLEEKYLVTLNLLRDIMENEASVADVVIGAEDEEIERALRDRASRRREILAEIDDFLFREDSGGP